MLTRPDLPDAALVGALADAWNLNIVSLEYRAVGFGSHHWSATDASGRRWFVTVDDLDAKRQSADEPPEAAFERLRAALATARAVSEAGATFVVAPIPARDGSVVRRVSARFALAVYPYIDGVSVSGGYQAASDRLEVLELIVELHASPRALMRALGALAEPWDHGPYSRRARELLSRHAERVMRLLARYDQLANEASDHPVRMVLTHGEPHSENVIITANGRMLIDWDTTMIAPPERDLWMLESGDGTVVGTYTKVTGRQVLSSMLDLYRRRWDLTEVALYIALFRQPHVDNADARESWKNLHSYLAESPC